MEKNKTVKKGKSNFLGYLYAILLILGLHIFFYQPFTIPSGSMIPTLLVGDHIFVNKFMYGFSRYSCFFQPKFITGRIDFSNPKRGDVAVFFHKFTQDNEAAHYDHGMFNGAISRFFRNFRETIGIPEEGVNYVKRVIGLPGDKIQMKSGKLFINGEQTKLEHIGEYPLKENGEVYIAKLYKETLPGGLSHQMLKIFKFGQATLDETAEFQVPEKHYFMMGDNRDNSCDSREIKKVGFIPQERFIGKPHLIFFSTEAKLFEIHKWLFAIRYKRLFNIIN